MELVKPDLGLLFWMLVTFSIVLFILKKYAWSPILKSLKQRDESIEHALQAAEGAKAEMAKLQSNNEKVMAEAKSERDAIVKEARDLKDKIVAEAKEQAHEEAKKMIDSAKQTIESEKQMAINDMKTQIVQLSIQIAEKVIHEQLADPKSAQSYADESMKDIFSN